MPHCIIEYSDEIEKKISPKHILDCAHSAVFGSGLFKFDDIKVRTMSFENYLVGGEVKSFAHVTVYILAGRTVDKVRCLTQNVMKNFSELLHEVEDITVEVVECNKDTYGKK